MNTVNTVVKRGRGRPAGDATVAKNKILGFCRDVDFGRAALAAGVVAVYRHGLAGGSGFAKVTKTDGMAIVNRVLGYDGKPPRAISNSWVKRAFAVVDAHGKALGKAEVNSGLYLEALKEIEEAHLVTGLVTRYQGGQPAVSGPVVESPSGVKWVGCLAA